ncbi:MAG: DUF58 domain-containing protein [Deltaproteobacteria bacterium]|nr:DUF58 domain-containing protein [Deltaproteobacteria bacterium]
MPIRPFISTPLPWLTMLAGKFFSKKNKENTKDDNQPKLSERAKLYLLPRSLKFTKEGKRFIVLLILIGIAAINTGNNLLYLVVAMLLSLIVISGFMSEATLRKLHAKREAPRYAFKGIVRPIRIRVFNFKKYFPSFSFLIAESENQGFTSSGAYAPKLDAKKEKLLINDYTFKKRGVAKLHALTIKTRFPFGLFIKGKTILQDAEVLVYPEIREITPENINASGQVSKDNKDIFFARKESSGELRGVRDYLSTDEARRIHWRALARTGNLLLKEFEDETEKKILIIFSNTSGKDLRGKEEREKAFEESVTQAASLTVYYINNGFSVGLKTISKKISPSTGDSAFHLILSTLAMIEPEGKGEPSVRVLTL